MTVAVIDTGANLASLGNALDALGADWDVTLDPEVVHEAERVILPGVGAAGPALRRLRESGLAALVPGLSRPVLGICLGLQLLCESTEESDSPALGVFPVRVREMIPEPGRPVPHMGWNRLRSIEGDALFDGIGEGTHCYFVHGYAANLGVCTVASCDYGGPFSAALSRSNFHAVQFHPERSGPAGARVLRNFLDMPCA